MFNDQQTFPNFCENLYLKWLMSFLNLENPKRKTHKIHMNNSPCKTIKKYVFGTKKFEKQTKIATNMDL